MEIVINLAAIAAILIGRNIYYKLEGHDSLAYSAVLFLMVFPYRRILIDYISFTDNAIDIYLFVEFIYYVIYKNVIISKYHSIFIGGFIVSTVMYSIFSNRLSFIITAVDTRFMIGMLLFVTLILSTANNKKSYKTFIRIFSYNALILSVIDLIYKSITNSYGISAYLLGANFLAVYVYIGFIFWLYDRNKNKLFAVIRFFSIGIIFFEIITLHSSSIYICLFIVLSIIYVMPQLLRINKSSLKIILIYVFLASVMMFIIVFSGGAEDNGLIVAFMKLRNHEDYYRIQIWNEAFDIFLENPLFGIGANNFRDTITGQNFPAHNDYMRLLAETGMCGFICFSIFSIKMLFLAINIKNVRDRLFIFSICLSLYVFILFHGYINYLPFYAITLLPFLYRKTMGIDKSKTNSGNINRCGLYKVYWSTFSRNRFCGR